jgi:hypothetical protein
VAVACEERMGHTKDLRLQPGNMECSMTITDRTLLCSHTACAVLTPEGDLRCQPPTLSVSYRSSEKYSVVSNVMHNNKTNIDPLAKFCG